MHQYRVLVVTNLWPTEADPSYGAAIRAQMESLRPFGVDYDVLFVNGRESVANYLRGIFEVRRRVAAQRYDLIYAHFGLSGWVARFQWKVPVLVKFMGDDVLGRFDRKGGVTLVGRLFQISSFVLARWVEGTIVLSEEMKRKLRLKKTSVIGTGVNLDLFRPLDRAEARQSLGLDPGKKYVLFPYGPDRPAKRFDLVLEAVRLARAAVPELEILQIFGVPQEQMPVYFNAAEVFVLVSESEGSPNTPKEAMAVNLPVISVDVRDVAELIGGSEGNYIVPRTAEAVAEKLVEVCRRGGYSRGREHLEQCSMQDMARKVFEACKGVVGRSSYAKGVAERDRPAPAHFGQQPGSSTPLGIGSATPRPSQEQILEHCERLHAFLVGRHYAQGLLQGPDPGVRFNWRLWRFAKSAMDFIPWRDDYVFTQTQGNWVLANWLLHDATGKGCYREIALESTDATLALQKPEGYWPYPLPERRHLIAALEGIWGATALLVTYSRTSRPELLRAAICAYDFITTRIGFQKHSPGEAINYFDKPRGKVPNNSVIAVWFFLRLWHASGEDRFLEHVSSLLQFIAAVQMPSGEIPYIVDSPLEKARDHYLCFQYNAHQFLHLCRSEQLRPGLGAKPILGGLWQFLRRGVRPNGSCANDCASVERGGPEVNYYTAALGAALHQAYRLGVDPSDEAAQRCFARVLARQRSDGSFGFSTGDYGFLRDDRSYPRQQAMTLFHLLSPLAGEGSSSLT